MMTESHGLRCLKMREARHDGCGMFFCTLKVSFDQTFKSHSGLLHFLLDPEAEINRHLIVAGASRVQTPCRCANQIGKARFDIHVNVFKLAREGEFAVLDFLEDGFQAFFNLFMVVCRNDASLCKHGSMGERALNILRIELAVKADRCIDLFHDRIGS